MNTSTLKAIAPSVRRGLIDAVGRKLDVVLAAESPDYRSTFSTQVAALRELGALDRDGLVEAVAYTWFNRFLALRYLDARGWHPFGARVLTAAADEQTQPELLRLALNGALPAQLRRHTNVDRLENLIDGRVPSSNPQAEVYREMVLSACRFYHELLPDLFERLDDATELLLPDDLLTQNSIVGGFRTGISDQDCADVEILGWLYQFYISEKKDDVMARKEPVRAADIPAVTQLFTPHWIVRTLVENSLGRLWLSSRPSSPLRERMPFYIECQRSADSVTVTKPEEIRLIDPAVGSGHILTYSFDLLYAIYEEDGYPAFEIPGLILRHNLFGVDIDPRAAQIAALALVLKARERSPKFFQSEVLVRPNVIALQDVRFDESELQEYVRALGLGTLFDPIVGNLLRQFEETTTFGSLIRPLLGSDQIAHLRQAIATADVGEQLFLSRTHQKVMKVLEQADYLSRKYHVVAANPPYMGRGSFSALLRAFAKDEYDSAGPDLYGAFLVRSITLGLSHAYLALVTMNGWMFLSRFEACRELLLSRLSLELLVHLGARGFDSLSGDVVQTAVVVFSQQPPVTNANPYFVDLRAGGSEAEKEAMLLDGTAPAYAKRLDLFRHVPGSPLAHWLSEHALSLFVDREPLSSVGTPRCGMITGTNATFVRRWHEVSYAACGFQMVSRSQAKASGKKWFPYLKGGGFRRWSGNFEFVVNWERDGEAIRTRVDERGHVPAHAFNDDFVFRPSVNWNKIMGDDFGVRFNRGGFMFDDGSAAIFPPGEEVEWCAGFLNSCVAAHLLRGLNPTVNIQAWNIGSLPVCSDRANDRTAVVSNVRQLEQISKAEWDSSERSWDFSRSPMLESHQRRETLEKSWDAWREKCTAAARRMADLETTNNRLFIAAYGLEGDLSSQVSERDVTVSSADRRRDAAAFLSYAVGCMMGRFSLDAAGLILADAGATFKHYLAKVDRSREELSFEPDADGVIPVLDGDWFEDDVVARTREFLVATFGEPNLRENIRWLEESLGKELRKYFLADFYRDHLQAYKKRPIYWMIQSPKKSFCVLVYLHRYTRDTLHVVLNRYLREYLTKIRSRLARISQSLASNGLSIRESTSANRETDRLTKVLHECEEWERQSLLPLAQQRIALELDDGVWLNYQKLAEVLTPIAGLGASDD